jgi:hypothetical protein
MSLRKAGQKEVTLKKAEKYICVIVTFQGYAIVP